MANSGIWRHADGALPNTLALCYVPLAQIAGIALMSQPIWLLWIPGALLAAHAMVIAAYLIHDVAHQSVFASKQVTRVVGEGLSWVCGAAYAPFRRIQHMHIRHHADRADLTLFDPRAFLMRAPAWLRRSVFALEWLYVPAVELIMHYQVVLRPFYNPRYTADRPRVIVVGLSRLVFFAVLWMLGWQVLLGYGLAYMLFLTALFVADAYAHTYEFYLVDDEAEPVPRDGRDAKYDRLHTYSNLISERWPLLNLLNLNFGYHNAHHDRPGTPWHRLPALHAMRYANDDPQILPYKLLWRTFRRNRLKRILAEDPGDISVGSGRADAFLGVHGVSFLSIV